MLNELGAQVHQEAKDKGFWQEENNPAETLMLIVSELSEALEEIRSGHSLRDVYMSYHFTPDSSGMPDITVSDGKYWLHHGTPIQREMTAKDYEDAGFLAKPEGVPIEMADALIRILDACAAWGIDIEDAVARKRAYNATRSHRHGGKRF